MGKRTWHVVAGVAWLAAFAPGVAQAQVLFTQPSGRTTAIDPLDYYLDGPPDVPGCIRECVRDYSPCDDAYTKQIDGRCKHMGR